MAAAHVGNWVRAGAPFILRLTPRDFWKVLCRGPYHLPSVFRVKGLLLTAKEGHMGSEPSQLACPAAWLSGPKKGQASFVLKGGNRILFLEDSPGRTSAVP